MAKGTKPTHRAYVNTGTKDHPFWVTVGAGWANEDGKSISFKPDLFPVGPCSIYIRLIEAKDAAEAEGGAR